MAELRIKRSVGNYIKPYLNLDIELAEAPDIYDYRELIDAIELIAAIVEKQRGDDGK